MAAKLFVFANILIVYFCFQIRLTTAERKYWIQTTSMDEFEFNPDYLAFDKCKVSKLNKTLNVVKCKGSLVQEFPSDAICRMKCYQNQGGGKYGEGPVQIPPMNCCEFFDQDEVIWPSLLKSSNFPKKCPFSKQNFEVKSFNINDANLPDTLPDPDEWYIQLTAVDKDEKIIFKGNFYGTINRL
ncbi:uncharacterized protein [Periplaneta americana]|uniref:uncharacterized protein n=1 Tax=Periplaneta americana TaxID=6978 RepID=UPI0037E85A5E